MNRKNASQFIAGIIMELAMLVFLNTVPLWQAYTQGVILPSWVSYLWAANISVTIRLAGNIILLIHRPARLYLLIQSVTMAAGVFSMVVFLIIFPIDFGAISLGWLNTFIRVVSLVGLVLGAIGAAVNLVKAVRGAEYAEDAKKQPVQPGRQIGM